MILSEIKLNKYTQKEVITQKIKIICDCCEKIYEIPLHYQMSGYIKYNKDLCRGCKQKDQIKSGIRGIQYINAGKSSIKNMKGKSHIEYYGEEKAENMRKINSEKNKGVNNKNHNGTWYGDNPGKSNKGKTFDEIHGKQKADIIRRKISTKCSGEKNGMYGKPSPNGSGNGWCGWYKGFFFRSLLELSFLINYVDRFNMKCKSAENKIYKIKYKDKDTIRNYFADFIINDKYLIEVKPKNLINSHINILKKEAAIIFCGNNNLIYKILSPNKLSFEIIENLVKSEKIIFIDRYKLKYDEYVNNH